MHAAGHITVYILFFLLRTYVIPAGITKHTQKKWKALCFCLSRYLFIFLVFFFFVLFFHPLIRVAYGPHLPWWPPCGALDIVKTSQTIIALRNLLGRLTTKFRCLLSFWPSQKVKTIEFSIITKWQSEELNKKMERYKGENAVWLLRGPTNEEEELAKSRRETRNDWVRIPASKQSAFT